MASMFGSTFLLPLYYQQARHLSVSQAGLILGSLSLGKGMAMTYVGKLIERTSVERAITLTGMALAIAGLAPYALAGRDVSQTLLIGALFITGLGQGDLPPVAWRPDLKG
jgi:fucose permease